MLTAALVAGVAVSLLLTELLGLSGFTKLLQGEASEIKNYLPSSLSSLWGSVTTGAPTVRAYDRPVAPVIDEPKRSTGWLWPAVAAVAACLGILWLIQRNPSQVKKWDWNIHGLDFFVVQDCYNPAHPHPKGSAGRYKQMKGAQYTLQGFHDAFLAQGYPPVKIVRKALLGNDSPVL